MTDLQIPAIAITLCRGTILKAGRARVSNERPECHVKSHLDCLRFMSATFSRPLRPVLSATFAATAVLPQPIRILTFLLRGPARSM